MNKNDIKDSFLINFLNEFKTSHFQNEQLRRGLQSDIQRIIDKDKDFQFALKDVKKLNGTELIQYLEKESDQWRYDGWRVKRFAAVVDQLKVLDPDKADLVREFLKTKKNNLPAESQQVIELIE